MSTTAAEHAFAEPVDSWELRRPETSVLDMALACAVALLAVLCVRPFFDFKPGSDEGIAFQGAMRILKGELPYRDFFVFYTPGSYYLYAALFRLFGASIGVARTLLAGYAAVFSLLTYLLARRACSRYASMFAASLLALICLPSRFENLHSWDSSVAALLALYCAVWFLQTHARWWAFFAGVLTGCTAMMEQTRGAGMILGLGLAALALHRIDRKRWNPHSFFPAVLGSVIPVLAVLAYFAANHSLTSMFAGWFWPLHNYTAANKLPYGYIFWSQTSIFGTTSTVVQLVFATALSAMVIVSLLPILILATTTNTGIKLLRGRNSTPLSLFVLLVGAVLIGNILASMATSRPDYFRIVYAAPLFFFAMPLLLDSRLIRLPSLVKFEPLILVYMLVAFTMCYLMLGTIAHAPNHFLETRRGIVRTDSDEVLPYLLTHLAPGERVLMYPYAAMNSFLSATFSPTRFDFLQPGMHTAAQFDEAQKELKESGAKVVVFDLDFFKYAPEVWPSTPREVWANDPMGDYIRAQYRICKILKSRKRPFAYMVRKDLPCPTD